MAVSDVRHLRLQVYVDDPTYVARGPRHVILQALSRALVWASVLGFPISWGKSDGGTTARWIGAQASVSPSTSQSKSRSQDKIEEILRLLLQFSARPVVGKHSRASQGS